MKNQLQIVLIPLKYKLITGSILLSFFLIISCDRPVCESDNDIFNTYDPNTKIYKDELVKQLKLVDNDQLRYWLKSYDDDDGIESIYFYIQGDNLCAILHLTMIHWDKLERVREKKGGGRRGAEFTKLTFDIYQDSLKTEFIYKNYDSLID